VCALYPTLAASKQAASRHIYTYLFNNNEFVGFPNFELWFGGREGGRQVGPKSVVMNHRKEDLANFWLELKYENKILNILLYYYFCYLFQPCVEI